jgi:hypothetical protein
MSKYTILFTDMVSEDFACWVKTDIIPLTGESVTLPSEGKGRVLFTEHAYTKDKNEFVVLGHLVVYLDWKV